MSDSVCRACNEPLEAGARFCGGCGVSTEADGGGGTGQNYRFNPIGQLLMEQFEVKSKLGEGGMGGVYLAEQRGMDRKAVVKVLHPHLSENERWVERFHREARIASRLSHPHTITLFNFGKAPEGFAFIAMEYVDGPTLADLIDQVGPLGVDRVVRLIEQVAGALQEAHDVQVVHRDLKPDNILVATREGEDWAKLVDFGIAKVIGETEDDEAQLTQAGTIIGTPAYMSPEQFNSDTLDGRADQYSLAVLAYEMLLGMRPFNAGTPARYFKLHAEEDPPAMSELNPAARVPAAVEAVVRRSLSKSPAARFDRVKDFAAALAAAAEAPAAEAVASPSSLPSSASLSAGKPEKSRSSQVPAGSAPVADSASTLKPTQAMASSASPRSRPSAQKSAIRKAVVAPSPSSAEAPSPVLSPAPGRLLWFTLVLLAGVGMHLVLRHHAVALPSASETAGAVGEQPEGRALIGLVEGLVAAEPEAPEAAPFLPEAPTRDLGLPMISIPGGRYALGAAGMRENRQRIVEVKPFALDRDEISNGLYGQCVADGACESARFARDSKLNAAAQPVVGVRFQEAQAFCAWASKRLPLAIEWEAAARGSEGRLYPWGEEFNASNANLGGKQDGHQSTSPVGSFEAGNTPTGIRDMSGNATEWVVDPAGEGQLRGGSFRSSSGAATTVQVLAIPGGDKTDMTVGFRCARDETPAPSP